MKDKSLKVKKKKTKKTIIGYVVSILCLLLCLYITIEVIVANNQNRPPRIFNLSVSYVPTESMEPTIKGKTYILFCKADVDDIKTGSGTVEENHENRSGDIIVYYNKSLDKFIVHRVVGIDEDSNGRYFIVWGDNNLVQDELKVRDDMIYGEYITTLNFLNFLSGGTNTSVIFIIIIIIFVIMIAMQVVQIVLKSKTEKIKKDKEDEKKQLIEEMKKQIIAEEIAKLKAKQQEIESNKAISLSEENKESQEEIIENNENKE